MGNAIHRGVRHTFSHLELRHRRGFGDVSGDGASFTRG
jgi:hypothetical protein